LWSKYRSGSTLSRFRTALIKEKGFDKLFKEINTPLAKPKIIIKKGVMADTSVVDTPLKPKGKH
jgi:IS5 family transposase